MKQTNNNKMRSINFKNSVIALVFGLFAVSCGGSGSKQQSNTKATETKTSVAVEETKKVDVKTVAGYLSQFGLTENDIKPDGFTSFEGPEGWLIKINAGANLFNDWSKKVYDKVKTISTDGKMYYEGYPSLGKEEAFWSADKILYQWAYLYNGKVVNLNLARDESGAVYHFSIHF